MGIGGRGHGDHWEGRLSTRLTRHEQSSKHVTAAGGPTISFYTSLEENDFIVTESHDDVKQGHAPNSCHLGNASLGVYAQISEYVFRKPFYHAAAFLSAASSTDLCQLVRNKKIPSMTATLNPNQRRVRDAGTLQ